MTLTQKEIDQIAEKHNSIAIETFMKLGQTDETVEMVKSLLAEEKIDVNNIDFHKVNGNRDIFKLLGHENLDDVTYIDLTYPLRCKTWSDAAKDCGETLKDSEQVEYDICTKIHGLSVAVLPNKNDRGQVAIMEAPVEHHIREDGVLSNWDGPAIVLPDGSKLYAIDDIVVPEWIVETPAAEMDLRKIIDTTNVDHRRFAVQKVGVDKFLDDAEVLDRVGSYQLVNMSQLFDGEKALFLSMVNPSTKEYHVERVTNDCKTVQDAHDYRSGVTGWNPLYIDSEKQNGGNKYQVQQGDVCFRWVSNSTVDSMALSTKDLLRSATGGRHTLRSGTVFGTEERQQIVIDKDTFVDHPTHSSTPLINFENGYWEAWAIVELDYATGTSQAVVD